MAGRPRRGARAAEGGALVVASATGVGGAAVAGVWEGIGSAGPEGGARWGSLMEGMATTVGEGQPAKVTK